MKAAIDALEHIIPRNVVALYVIKLNSTVCWPVGDWVRWAVPKGRQIRFPLDFSILAQFPIAR